MIEIKCLGSSHMIFEQVSKCVLIFCDLVKNECKDTYYFLFTLSKCSRPNLELEGSGIWGWMQI